MALCSTWLRSERSISINDEMTELNPKNLRFDAAGFTGCKGANLNLNDEMTELNPKNLRFDAAGFTGCKGANPSLIHSGGTVQSATPEWASSRGVPYDRELTLVLCDQSQR